jgi:CRISPR-associated protein Csd1
MNWMQNLYMTYENCSVSVGYAKDSKQRPLLPICHITTQAHIEIVLDGEGNFQRARILFDKADSTTIIPATESSASRSGSRPDNHPLCDKLQYVAGDFLSAGGVVTSGFKKEPKEPFQKYVKLLNDWCNSPYTHPKAAAVLKYIQKQQVIADLVKKKILLLSPDKKFLEKEMAVRDKNTKDIFSVVDPQENAFVRWVIEVPGEEESRVWRDASLWESWSNYYLSGRTDLDLCYVTGEQKVITTIHPKFIRREGDGAKIISANDNSGFTFRGRFLEDTQACEVGLETSQKAHYALSWLISRQGYRKGDLAIVAWAISGQPVLQPTDDAATILFGDSVSEKDLNVYTAQDKSIALKNRIAGYGKALRETDNIAVMAVNSATPGRLSITYYRDLKGSDFLSRIDTWHDSCAWLHRYRKIKDADSGKDVFITFFGAPAPSDIAEAAYGIRVDDKLRTATIARLLPCIIDGQPMPRDLVECAVRRASNREGMDHWEWEKTLSIACALYKKLKYGKENYSMPLDETRTSRDYLYGRLLAIADLLEERALYKGEQKRPTNAARYMQQFSQSPYRTWKQIHDSLSPYILKLQGAHFYKNLIAQVQSMFDPEEFMSSRPLSGEYLLGYYSQRQKLLEKKDKPEEKDTQDDDQK